MQHLSFKHMVVQSKKGSIQLNFITHGVRFDSSLVVWISNVNYFLPAYNHLLHPLHMKYTG